MLFWNISLKLSHFSSFKKSVTLRIFSPFKLLPLYVISNILKIMDNQGIMTVDLIFATLLIIIVAGSIITVVSDRMDTASQTEELTKARMTADNVAEAINKVYSGGTGHSMTVNLPDNITDKNYYINVNSSGVYVTIGGMIGKAYITPKKFSDSYFLREAPITMYNGENYTIKNVNGSDGHNWIVITRS